MDDSPLRITDMSDGMHIEVTGCGPAIVMLHGWALNGGVFAPLVQRLSDRYTLYLVDLPGHGLSHADATPLQLEACVAQIAARTPPALWLGWSLGGLFALHAAATRPDRVQGLMMVCATPRFVRAPDWPNAVEHDVFNQFGDELQRNYRGTLERFIALDTHGSDHARAELRLLRELLYARGEPAMRALQEGLQLLHDSDLRDLLPTLQCPSLWIGGRRDRLVPSAGMRDAAALASRAMQIEIARGAHAPFIGHADEVAQAIDRFISSSNRHPREGGDPATCAVVSGQATRNPVTGSPPSRG